MVDHKDISVQDILNLVPYQTVSEVLIIKDFWASILLADSGRNLKDYYH